MERQSVWGEKDFFHHAQAQDDEFKGGSKKPEVVRP